MAFFKYAPNAEDECCSSCCDGEGHAREGPCEPCVDPSLGGEDGECEVCMEGWDCDS